MAVVLSLVERRNEETIQVLASLFGEARRGEVTDVCMAYRRREGDVDFAFTGLYLDPSKALFAAMRMSVQLTLIEEEVRGRP